MNSSRRGFLGLLGGGAFAGPKAVKQAFAKVASTGIPTMTNVGISSNLCVSDDQSWRAREVLSLLRGRHQKPSINLHQTNSYPNIEALHSVSKVNKHRMSVELDRERALTNSIRELVQHYRLDWIGLSEEQLIGQIEKIAGDRT